MSVVDSCLAHFFQTSETHHMYKVHCDVGHCWREPSATLAAADANSRNAAASRDPSAAETRQRASQVPLFVFEQAA